MAHLSLAPYKESVTIKCRFTLQCGVGRSFRPSGGSYAPAIIDTDLMIIFCKNCVTAAYVGFENTAYSVLESDGVVTVCLTVDRGDGWEQFYMYLFSADLTTQGWITCIYL